MIIEPQNLTPGARIALVTADFRAGSVVPMDTPFRVVVELANLGLVGFTNRLTRDGAIVRARILDGLEES